MLYLPLEGLLPQADGSSYKLVRLVASRALEIGEGASKLVDAPAQEKPATTAMREILAGKVMITEVAEKNEKARKAAAKAAKKD